MDHHHPAADFSAMTNLHTFVPSIAGENQLPQFSGSFASNNYQWRMNMVPPSHVPPVEKLRIISSTSLHGQLPSPHLCTPGTGQNNPSESPLNLSNSVQCSSFRPPYYQFQQPQASSSWVPWPQTNGAFRFPDSVFQSLAQPAQMMHASPTAVMSIPSAPTLPSLQILPTIIGDPFNQSGTSLNQSVKELVTTKPFTTHFCCCFCQFTASTTDRVLRHLLRSHFSQGPPTDRTPAFPTLSPHENFACTNSSIDTSHPRVVIERHDVDTQVPSPNQFITDNNHNRDAPDSSVVDNLSTNADLPILPQPPPPSPHSLLKSKSKDPQNRSKQGVSRTSLICTKPLRTGKRVVPKLRETFRSIVNPCTTDGSQLHNTDTPTSGITSESHFAQFLGIHTSPLVSSAIRSSDHSQSDLVNTVRRPVFHLSTVEPTASSGSLGKRRKRKSHSTSSNDTLIEPSVDEVSQVPIVKSPAYSSHTPHSVNHLEPVLSSCSAIDNPPSSCLADPKSVEYPQDADAAFVPITSTVANSNSWTVEPHTTPTRSSPELLVDMSSLVFRPLREKSPDHQAVTKPPSPTLSPDVSPNRTSTHSIEGHVSEVMVSPSAIPTPLSLTKSSQPICSDSSLSSSSLSSLGDEEDDDLIFVGFTLVGKGANGRPRHSLKKCEEDSLQTNCTPSLKRRRSRGSRVERRSLDRPKRLRRTASIRSSKPDTISHSSRKVSEDRMNKSDNEQAGSDPSAIIAAGDQDPAPISEVRVNITASMAASPSIGINHTAPSGNTLQSAGSRSERTSFEPPHRHAPRKSPLHPIPIDPLELVSTGYPAKRSVDRITVDLVTGELFVDDEPLRNLVSGMRLSRMVPWRQEPPWNSRAQSRRHHRLSHGSRRGRPRRTDSITNAFTESHSLRSYNAPTLIATIPTSRSTPNNKIRSVRSRRGRGSKLTHPLSTVAESRVVRQPRGRPSGRFVGRRKRFPVSGSLRTISQITDSGLLPSSSR